MGNGNSTSIAPAAGAVVKQEMGPSMEVRSEVAASAVAKRQEATIQALFVMAERKPRDWDTVRVKLMRECQRPGFAEVARYRKPIGEGIEGPSIRFAEAAIRLMGNVMVDAQVTLEDDFKRKIEVVVIDLESCVRYAREVVVEKTVERSYVKDGQQVLSQRVNSHGKKTFLVVATEDEIANKQAAQISKALRTEGLRLLPGDILEECMEKCIETLAKKDAEDPDAAKKKVLDAFAAVGVKPDDLKKYLGHEASSLQPAELTELRALFAAIKDGEATWAEALEQKTGKAAPTGGVTAPPPPQQNSAAAAPATAPVPHSQGTAPTAAADVVPRPETATTVPANVVQFQRPAEPDLTEEEKAIDAALKSAKTKGEAVKTAPLIARLPLDAQKRKWRAALSARTAELP